MESTYYSLASKNTFNKALRHFYKVSEVVDEVEGRKNLADVLNDELDNEEVHVDQLLPIVGAVIRDKYAYSFDSFNIPVTISEFDRIADETFKWTALDFVLVYYNPGGKIYIINPKNIDHWERARELIRDQLLVVYAKVLKGEDKKIEKNAINAIEEMLAGKDIFASKDFVDSTVMARKPTPRPAPAPIAASGGGSAPVVPMLPKGKRSITPKYAVQVSNELFHNGNVEAWKKIIESYMHSFPDLELFVYHEGELINDINALFKWGKVKHGDSIFFQVAGENIRGVSKLQKYLYEGAGPRFEQFLKIGIGQILHLF